MNSSPLIEVRDLAARLEDPGWIVVDCRFNLIDPDAGAAQYRDAHIPGARYLDLDKDMAGLPGPQDGRHPLPAPAD